MPSARILLLTGRPGVGKTTLLRRVAETLRQEDAVEPAGFYTAEIREGGRRRGFRLIPFDGGGEGEVMAHVERAEGPRVSRYGVDVDAVDRMTERTLVDRPSARLYLVDEIGKMECYSEHFVEAVEELLRGPVPLVATVARRGGGLIGGVKDHPEAEVVEVKRENRDELVERVVGWVRQRL